MITACGVLHHRLLLWKWRKGYGRFHMFKANRRRQKLHQSPLVNLPGRISRMNVAALKVRWCQIIWVCRSAAWKIIVIDMKINALHDWITGAVFCCTFAWFCADTKCIVAVTIACWCCARCKIFCVYRSVAWTAIAHAVNCKKTWLAADLCRF